MFHGHLDYFQEPPLAGRPNTKPGDHGTPNAHNCWFILWYHVRGPAWWEIHWNNIWLRIRSYMASHFTWGSVTTLHDFGGVLERPLVTFIWALTIDGHGSWLMCEVTFSWVAHILGPTKWPHNNIHVQMTDVLIETSFREYILTKNAANIIYINIKYTYPYRYVYNACGYT